MKDRYKTALRRLGKNKYILILIAAGLVLMLLGTGGSNKKAAEPVTEITESRFSVEELENRLSKSLSKINGAGRVQVVLTVSASTEKELAVDTETSERFTSDGSERQASEKTVVIDSGSDEAPVVLRYVYPEFRGAVVIAEGADSTAVQLALTRAVANLTGLGTDKISVIKMAE